MTTQPTDPTTAVATIRRAATAMRDTANGAVEAGWIEPTTIDQGTFLGRSGPSIGAGWRPYPYGHEPGKGTPENYIGDIESQEFANHIASWTPPIALLVAGLLDVVVSDITETLADHGGNWFGPVPAEWTAAYNLAAAYLERRPEQ